jgi:hypothetical protein
MEMTSVIKQSPHYINYARNMGILGFNTLILGYEELRGKMVIDKVINRYTDGFNSKEPYEDTYIITIGDLRYGMHKYWDLRSDNVEELQFHLDPVSSGHKIKMICDMHIKVSRRIIWLGSTPILSYHTSTTLIFMGDESRTSNIVQATSYLRRPHPTNNKLPEKYVKHKCKDRTLYHNRTRFGGR